MTKVCLIDGSGYIFRAFYALPTMTTPEGIPVNAVYGFLTMFMRLIKTIKCDHCVVLFDAKRQNFRNEFFADYKATRAEVPDLLIPQFDLIYNAVQTLNLSYVLQEGYEADDLIATYARQALEKGMEAVIVSADKDLMQLIRPGVEFYDGMKDKFFTDEDVKEKFGVYPNRVVDVQALSGDKTDNIPGIPGIGLKIAAELINQFGSLEGVLENAHLIKQQKRRELIMNNRESAEISLKLVTLKDDVPVEKSIEEFECKAPVSDKVMNFIDKLGFKSLRPKMEKWIEERCCELYSEINSKPQKIETKYLTVNNRTDLENLYRDIISTQKFCFKFFANDDDVKAIGFTTSVGTTYYMPLPEIHYGDDLISFNSNNSLQFAEIQKFLIAVFENKLILKVGLYIKEQWHLLNNLCGKRVDMWPYDDVAIMSYVLDSSEHEHSLSVLSEMFLDEKIIEPKISGKLKEINFEAEEFDDFIFKASDYTFRLYEILKENLFKERRNYVYEMIERRLTYVLMNMEEEGITINPQSMLELDKEFELRLREIEKEIYQIAGEEFNLSSPKQIGEILFDKLGMKGAKKTPTGNYNTSAEVLEQLAEEYELPAKILEWRSYAKLKSTYTTSLLEMKDKNNVIHTTFSQTVVNTGRLASSNPNLQNIPNRSDIGRKIRECFVARPGYKLISADYSQMELRLLASVANVKALKESFASGIDIHAATAAKVFNLDINNVDREHRNRAKAINFGIVYGISQFGLAKQIGISKEQAKQYIESYFEVMPEVREYMDKTIEFARRNGYVLTPMGRKCSVLGINDKNHRISSFAERAAINAPIQGGAADIVKLAMIKVNNLLKEKEYDARILLQVHDELVLEVNERQVNDVAKLVKDVMENIVDLEVKMLAEVGIGDTWATAH